MDYEQFKTEYQHVFDSIDNQPSSHFAPDVVRLKALAAAIENPRERREAENRIARLEAGMDEIARIAETAEPAEPAEQASILNMNESLYMLIMSFESSGSR